MYKTKHFRVIDFSAWMLVDRLKIKMNKKPLWVVLFTSFYVNV